MKIKGFQETSLMEWKGIVAAILFVGGCNFRCCYCHNHALAFDPESQESIPQKEVFARLGSLKGWIDGVVISGGEPTLYCADIERLLVKLRGLHLKTKLFTNGSHPECLGALLKKGLLNAVSMDIKHSPEQYGEAIGMDAGKVIPQIQESVSLLNSSNIDVEYRMTIVKGMHTPADIREVKKLVSPKPLILQNVSADDIPADHKGMIIPFSLAEFEALQKEFPA